MLSGPLGQCILQSVCKTAFSHLKIFLLGNSFRFLIASPLLSGSGFPAQSFVHG